MQTIKQGSKGSDVKKLQELLLMDECDGIFGPKTDKVLRAWQSQHGLVSDGICGPKSWEALLATPATAMTGTSLNINYQPAKTICTARPGRKVKYIVIHYTAGSSSAAGKAAATAPMWLKRYKANPKSGASADFVVDDKEIVQVNPDLRNYNCWAVGGNIYSGYGGASLNGIATHANPITVEICSSHRSGYDISAPNHEGWYFTDAVLDNAVRLTRYLMKEFDITIERVIRHYDVKGKPGPGIVGWNDAPLFDAKTGKQLKTRNTSEKWQAFKRRLQ